MNPNITLNGVAPTASNAPVATAPVTSTAKTPSWWERLLPTAGGILGGIVGGVAAPFTGGIVNPVDLGGLLGAAGQAGENALTDKKVIQGNDLTAGLENAAGNVLGGGVTSMLTGTPLKTSVLGLSKALPEAAISAAGEGATNAATQAAGGILGKTSDISQGLSGGSLFDQFAKGSGVTKDLASDLNSNYGITNAEKSVPIIHSTITGSADNETGALANKAVMNAIQNSPSKTVDLGNLTGNLAKNGTRINPAQPDFTQSVIDKTHGLSPNDDKAIQNFVNYEYSKLPQSATGLTDNVSAFELSKSLANRAADISDQAAKAAGSAKTSLQATASVYDQLAQSIGDEVLAPGGQTLKVAPDEVNDVKQGIIQALGKSEPKAANQLVKDVDNITNPDGSVNAPAMRSLQSKWVQAMKALKTTKNIEQVNGGLTSADIMRGTLGATGSPAKTAMGIAAAIPKTKALNQVGSTVFSKLANTTGKAAASKIIPLLARTSAVGAANVPNIAGEGVGAGTIGTGTSTGTTSAISPTTGGTVTNNANDITALYNNLQGVLNAPYAMSSPAYSSTVSALNSIAPLAQKYELAAPIINNLLNTYSNAGGAQGVLGGAASRILGLVPGTAANTYARQQAAAASTIAQLLGISPQAAMQIMPQLTENAQTAAPQVSQLRSLMAGMPTPQ